MKHLPPDTLQPPGNWQRWTLLRRPHHGAVANPDLLDAFGRDAALEKWTVPEAAEAAKAQCACRASLDRQASARRTLRTQARLRYVRSRSCQGTLLRQFVALDRRLPFAGPLQDVQRLGDVGKSSAEFQIAARKYLHATVRPREF